MNLVKQDFLTINPGKKPRITVFVDEMVLRRGKAKGALEGLTLSETVEKALDLYAPKEEKDGRTYISTASVSQLKINK